MKTKDIEKAIEEDRDVYSQELYGKASSLLTPGESWRLDEYIHDCRNPEWKIAITRKGDAIEVANSGKSARNPITKEPYKIYYPRTNNHYPLIDPVSSEGKRYPQVLHQLIAQAFVEKPESDERLEVNHIDGNKCNNWYRNLEWITHQENILHASRVLQVMPRGEDNNFTKYTDDQIREVCQLLQDHPEMTYADIEQKTGIDKTTVAHIHNREIRIDVSADYEFSKRIQNQANEENSNAKLTNTQVVEACKLIQTRPDLSFAQIGSMLNIPEYTIESIYHRSSWNDISKDYDFPNRESVRRGDNSPAAKYSSDDIKKICEILQNDQTKTFDEIADELGVHKQTISNVYFGTRWKHISKDYTFPPRQTKAKGENNGNVKYTTEQVRHVCDMLVDHPDWSFRKIAAELDVSRDLVKRVNSREMWTGVSNKYEFPIRNGKLFSDDQIFEVCGFLQNHPEMSYDEISERTGVSTDAIGKIYRGVSRQDISFMFDFPDRNSRGRNIGEINGMADYTEDQVRRVCELLDDVYHGKSEILHKDIANKVGVSKALVDHICCGDRWQHISKDYDFYKKSE